MAANTLLITKAYRDGIAFSESIVDGMRSDLHSWAQDTVDNLNQLRLDVFGSSYSYDNDGLANNTNPMNVQQTITPTATITALDIASSALTTGTGVDMSDLDALTTGRGFNLVSNSSDTNTRQLFRAINDNTAATGCTPIYVQQDAALRAVYINQTANAEAVTIDADGTGAAGNGCLFIDHEGTGPGLNVDVAGDPATNAMRLVVGSGAFSTDAFHINAVRAANSAYDFITASSGNDADVEFRARGDGEIYGDGAAYNSPAADYAEMFECVDKAGIEPGYFVTFDEKEPNKIRKATAGDKYILGLVSGKPAVIGDTAWNHWAKKYLYDEFNRYVLDEDGHRILNPKHREGVYIPRSERPEWVAVGLLGKLNVRVKQNVMGKFVDVDDEGFAKEGNTYRVMETVMPYNEKKGYGVIKIIFRGKE